MSAVTHFRQSPVIVFNKVSDGFLHILRNLVVFRIFSFSEEFWADDAWFRSEFGDQIDVKVFDFLFGITIRFVKDKFIPFCENVVRKFPGVIFL